MDVNDFFYLAQQLHGDDKQEVVYREVISLAYYACFHQISPLAKHIELPIPAEKKGMHKNLCWGLEEYGKRNYDGLPKDIARQFYSLGLKIEAARKERISASYSVDSSITQDMADDHLSNTSTILALIQDIKNGLKTANKFSDFFKDNNA